MADRKARRLRRLAAAARRERALARAAVRAYNRLFKALDPLLRAHNMDPAVLDDRLPAWRDAVDEELVPEVTATYVAAILEEAREGVTVDAQVYATEYLQSVHNRLVGVSDYVFDQIAATLAEGNLAGESIPELAARIDGLFTDEQRWARRATVVARTEVVGANNAGHQRAAEVTADQLGVDRATVVKEWLSSHDTRVRHTHREADAQQVLGLDAKFHVGEAHLVQPGDVTGPPEEVIQCRCSALYHFPDDLDYPEDLAAEVTAPEPAPVVMGGELIRGTHVTLHPNELLTGAYDLDKGGEWVAKFGQGVYIDTGGRANYYRKQKGKGAEVLDAVAQVHNPATVDADKKSTYVPSDPVTLLDTITGYPEKRQELADAYRAEYERRGGFMRSSEDETFYDNWPEGVPRSPVVPPEQVLTALGYDSLHVKQRNFTNAVGGDQWVVFDPKLVTFQRPADSVTAGGTMPDFDKLARLFDVSRMPPKLQAYWLGPEGAAKIGYGTPGQFKRCQAALRGKVPGHEIDGTCANLIHKATGEWPGKHGAAAASISATFTWEDALRYVSRADVDVWAVDTENPMVEPPADAYPADYEPTDVAEEEHDSAVIVALPAEADTVQGIGPEHPKHATLLFFGTTEQMDQPALLRDVASIMAKATQPFTVDVTKLERLGRDPAVQALVWELDAADLGALRTELLDTEHELQGYLEKIEQFPEYRAHVTIGWPESQDDDVEDSAWAAIEDAAGDVATVTFDRLAVWYGGERTEYPLGADTPVAAQPPAKEDDAAMTSAATEATPPVHTAAETDTKLTWSGVLCPEGVRTGDKRKFAEGAILWMADPGVLKAMFADKPGHDDSVPVGVIESIERVDGKLPFSGRWSTGPEAEKAREWNIDGRLRGVSVDLDDVEMHLEDDDGNVIEGEAIWDLEVEPTLVVDKARVRAATLWCTPAYVDAYVLDATVADQIPDTSIVDASGVTPLGLAAAAVYAQAATEPAPVADAAPASVFANPGLEEPTPLTVTEDGRVFGHLATWGTCHIGIEGACVTPPTSEADYAYFCTGMYATSDGEAVPVGQITMGTGHADLALGWRPTVDHYDDTGTAAAYISIGEDAIGIWFAGILNPHLPTAQRLALQRTGSVSGDWRDWGRGLELVAALAVNVPGFPIPRVQSRVASMAAAGGASSIRPVALVASGVVAHREAVAAASIDYALLAREVVAHQARQARFDATKRKMRKARQLALAGKIEKRS